MLHDWKTFKQMKHSSLRFVISGDSLLFITALFHQGDKNAGKNVSFKTTAHASRRRSSRGIVKQRGPALFCVSLVSKGSWVTCSRQSVYSGVC